MKHLIASLLAALLFALPPLPAHARGERAGLFDYYVLSLSWSPSFCLSKAGRRARKQCAPGARHGFIVHGLWPQFKRGWPSECTGAKRFVPDAVIRDVLDVMPGKGLVIHEWRKHGVCSGISPRAYFGLAEKLYRRIVIPKEYVSPAQTLKRQPGQIARDFARANKGFTKDMFAVVCKGRGGPARLSEVRVCFTPQGHPPRCGRNERRGCRARVVTIPPVR